MASSCGGVPTRARRSRRAWVHLTRSLGRRRPLRARGVPDATPLLRSAPGVKRAVAAEPRSLSVRGDEEPEADQGAGQVQEALEQVRPALVADA